MRATFKLIIERRNGKLYFSFGTHRAMKPLISGLADDLVAVMASVELQVKAQLNLPDERLRSSE